MALLYADCQGFLLTCRIDFVTCPVTFDSDAVKAIAAETRSDGLKVNPDDIGTEKLNTAQKSAVSVKHTLKAAQSPAGIVVWYIADDGTRTQIPASFRNGEVVFTVTHFSNYVIAYDAEKAAAAGKLNRFVDLDNGAWYADGVLWALDNGVMNGVSPKYFNPNGDTTRAMVATMLWRLEGSPVVSGEMKFVDVAEGTWYTEAVRWASDAGIITGSKIPAATTPWPMGFRPNDAVTRAQVATMLMRYSTAK